MTGPAAAPPQTTISQPRTAILPYGSLCTNKVFLQKRPNYRHFCGVKRTHNSFQNDSGLPQGLAGFAVAG